MTHFRVLLQPAFVLHTRAYRDTSFLVELLTAQYGRVSAIARGARSMRSQMHGVLTPFAPLLVSFGGSSDLQTLYKAENNGPSCTLYGNALLSAFYLNELIMRLLHRHDSHPSIYDIYKRTLDALCSSSQPEIELRLFEKCLLAEIGYGLKFSCISDGAEILPTEKYTFEFGVGFKKAQIFDENCYLGRSLLALRAGIFADRDELRDAKRLMRYVFAVLLDHKPLKSRELFV